MGIHRPAAPAGSAFAARRRVMRASRRIALALALALVVGAGFVLAARAQGAGDFRIIFSHILPNAMGPILVTATLGVAGAILTESALSFLGIGVQPPTPSWGNILTAGKDNITVLLIQIE